MNMYRLNFADHTIEQITLEIFERSTCASS